MQSAISSKIVPFATTSANQTADFDQIGQFDGNMLPQARERRVLVGTSGSKCLRKGQKPPKMVFFGSNAIFGVFGPYQNRVILGVP